MKGTDMKDSIAGYCKILRLPQIASQFEEEAFHLHLSARIFSLKSIQNGKHVLYQAPASWPRLIRLLCHFYAFGRPLECRRHCGNPFPDACLRLMILCIKQPVWRHIALACSISDEGDTCA